MKRFFCDCGSAVFFENDFCINCDSALGYDPARADMVTLAAWGGGIYRDLLGNEFRYCRNAVDFGVCNWLVPAGWSNCEIDITGQAGTRFTLRQLQQ